MNKSIYDENETRKADVFGLIEEISVLLGFDGDIISFERAIFSGNSIKSWDFFDAVHSEREKDLNGERGYLIKLDTGEKIFIGFNNCDLGMEYKYFSIEDLMKIEGIPEKILKIKEIETVNRKIKGILLNEKDLIHETISADNT